MEINAIFNHEQDFFEGEYLCLPYNIEERKFYLYQYCSFICHVQLVFIVRRKSHTFFEQEMR